MCLRSSHPRRCEAQVEVKPTKNFTPYTVPSEINKSPILLVYTSTLPLLDITFSAPAYIVFYVCFVLFFSSSSARGWCKRTMDQLSVILGWELNGTRSLRHPSGPPRDVLWLKTRQNGDTGPCVSWPGGSSGNQSSVLQELAGLKGSPLECWAMVLASIKSFLKLEIWSSWEWLWFNVIQVLQGTLLKETAVNYLWLILLWMEGMICAQVQEPCLYLIIVISSLKFTADVSILTI